MISITLSKSFYTIEKEWEELYNCNNKLSYYQSKEYMKVLWKNLFPYRIIHRVTPQFFLFKKHGQPILILPLFKKWLKKSYYLFGYKSGVGYLDAIYPGTITYKDFTDCFEELKKTIKNGVIRFEHVKESTELGKWIIENGGIISKGGCTEIPLFSDYYSFYNSLKKHMKQNIRTAYNRLSTDNGIFRFETIPYAVISEELSRSIQVLYLNRQISKYGKSVLYRLFVKYIDLGTKIYKAKNITVVAYILYINNEIAAFFDAILAGNSVIIPRLAISDEFNRYSPGIILLNESIKYLINNKVWSIDLTHGTEPYKLAMGGVVHHCAEMYLKL